MKTPTYAPPPSVALPPVMDFGAERDGLAGSAARRSARIAYGLM